MQIVEIQWTDACSNSGIYDRDDLVLLGLISMTTTGYLVEERDDCYILAAEHYYESNRWRHIQLIPKTCITGITKFRKTK